MLQRLLLLLLIGSVCPIQLVRCEQSGALGKKLETPHFIVLFDEAPGALDGMGQFLETRIQTVLEVFAANPDHRITLEVYPSIERFHQKQFGRKMEEWIVGNCDAKSRIIRMVSPNNPGKVHTYDSMLRVALHETVHQLTDLVQKDHTVLPVWLREGIAGYYSEQLDNKRGVLRDLIRSGKQPRIEELEGNGFAANNGYEFSAALVEYILRIYGREKLLGLLRDPRNLEKELSITLPNLNRNWHEDLVKTYL